MLQSQRSHWGFAPNLLASMAQVFSTEDSNELLGKLARLQLDWLTPCGWATAGQYIADCITSGDFSALCLYDPDVLDLPATDQYHIRQALAFFGKRQDLDIGVDREAAAFRKFREAETSCKLTNDCFRAWSQGRFQFHPLVERVLHAAQRKISSVLGDSPSLRDIRPRFGPGASTQVPKRNACVPMKLRHAPACSANLANHLEEVLSTVYVGNGSAEEFVDVEIHTAKLSFVPKNAKIDRAICTEPQLNGMFQLGLGDLMADRLRSVGIDIRDQSANQRAARYGSISGNLATLDLSSASDTVSLKLCEHLLPADWFDLLEKFRSCEMEYNGERIQLHKISSMGNGFTFPLETLIFWALSKSVADIYAPGSRVWTYGDDIIVATPCAEPLMFVLRALGFTPNPSKSFWTGHFRESCGQDYVFGTDVRPIYVDNALTGFDIFRLRNSLRRREAPGWELLEQIIHPDIRLYGPCGYGDGHLETDLWVGREESRHKGWSGFTFETWSTRPSRLKKEIMDRFFTLRRDHKKLHGANRYSGWRAMPVVHRIATYIAMQSASPVREGYSISRMMPSVVDRPVPNWHGTVDHLFVTPGGAQEWVRTKVYTFEPPIA